MRRASGTSNDRLMFALPNFLTLENSAHVPPLTTGQKFRVVARSSFDYVEIPWYGFQAGISQAENSEPGYGQGAAGYGKRFGAAAADGTIENFMTSAIFPSVFHQDPRYFQLGKGSFVHRAAYALSRILITRTDSGHNQFNVSEVFGSALAAAISTYSYHPRTDKTILNTAGVWGIGGFLRHLDHRDQGILARYPAGHTKKEELKNESVPDSRTGRNTLGFF